MKFIQSPYHSSRGNYKITGIVVHTTVGAYNGTLSWFQNNSQQVSAHYVVKEDGSEITQMVDESRAAHHAGIVENPTTPVYRGNNPNMYTIGIENADGGNPASHDRTKQLPVLALLVREICQRNNIPIDRDHICGHREIRSTKTCPGNIDIDRVVELAGSETMADGQLKACQEKLGWYEKEYPQEQQRVVDARRERDEALSELDRVRKEYEALKQDCLREKQALEIRNKEEKKRYQDFLALLASKVGTPQEEPEILGAIETLTGFEDKNDELERRVKELLDNIQALQEKVSALESNDPLKAYTRFQLLKYIFTGRR